MGITRKGWDTESSRERESGGEDTVRLGA